MIRIELMAAPLAIPATPPHRKQNWRPLVSGKSLELHFRFNESGHGENVSLEFAHK